MALRWLTMLKRRTCITSEKKIYLRTSLECDGNNAILIQNPCNRTLDVVVDTKDDTRRECKNRGINSGLYTHLHKVSSSDLNEKWELHFKVFRYSSDTDQVSALKHKHNFFGVHGESQTIQNAIEKVLPGNKNQSLKLKFNIMSTYGFNILRNASFSWFCWLVVSVRILITEPIRLAATRYQSVQGSRRSQMMFSWRVWEGQEIQVRSGWSRA